MTLAIDFDGVIHAYSKGWHDGTIYDPPLPGAIDGLCRLMEHDSVFVFTTRNINAVTIWLRTQGLSAKPDNDPDRTFWNGRDTLLVTNRKLAATAYLDDRAVEFHDWPQALAALRCNLQVNVDRRDADAVREFAKHRADLRIAHTRGTDLCAESPLDIDLAWLTCTFDRDHDGEHSWHTSRRA